MTHPEPEPELEPGAGESTNRGGGNKADERRFNRNCMQQAAPPLLKVILYQKYRLLIIFSGTFPKENRSVGLQLVNVTVNNELNGQKCVGALGLILKYLYCIFFLSLRL